MKTRSNSIDTWKGIAIIAVVGIHTCGRAVSSFPFENFNHWTGLFFCSIFNFSVALFFAISGYFSPSREGIEKQGIFRFYYKRLLPIWIPYLLWSGLYLAVRDWSLLLHPLVVLESLLTGSGITIGYFVIVLTFLTIMHPALARISRHKSLFMGFIFSMISVTLSYWIRIKYSDYPISRFNWSALPFTTWMVFFYLGFYIQGISNSSRPNKTRLLCFVGISYFLSLLESLFISGSIGLPSLAAGQIKFTTYLSSACLCIYALNYGASRLDGQKFLVWLGRHSYVFYLCHVLFLNRVKEFFHPYLYSNQFLFITASMVITILIVTISVFIAKRILPEPFHYYILGIKK